MITSCQRVLKGEMIVSNGSLNASPDLGVAIGLLDWNKKQGCLAHLFPNACLNGELSGFLDSFLKDAELVDGIYVVSGTNPILGFDGAVLDFVRKTYSRFNVIDHTQGRYYRTLNIRPDVNTISVFYH
jgi:hypothetical protein